MTIIVQGKIYRLTLSVVSFHLSSTEQDFLHQTGFCFTRNFRVRICDDLDGFDFATYKIGSYFIDANRLKNFPEIEISLPVFLSISENI